MKKNDVPPGYIERLFKAFYITNRQIQQDMAQAFKELHLTGPQFYILYLLCQEGGAKPTELADKLEVNPSAITVMVDRLIKAGLVRRE
ncbi:MarR family winged helix-turn-helix transcriptional regulator, partial [Rossellomorea marisflavi]|uniref:MarR family winged helix-turn-helix transcriptional regulator n=2 Tax=Bacillaceae TaxID=186817 RepID=UPI00351115E7